MGRSIRGIILIHQGDLPKSRAEAQQAPLSFIYMVTDAIINYDWFIMRNYYRIVPGSRAMYIEECKAGSFIGVDFGIYQDLSNDLPEHWQDFNEKFRPIWLENNDGKTKIAAGLGCGTLHTVCKGIQELDIVLCSNSKGGYSIGEVVGPYYYADGEILFHRRPVRWLPKTLQRDEMSDPLKFSLGSILTAIRISKPNFIEEIENLLGEVSQPSLIATDEYVEDPTVFGLEKHLEEFLVTNWKNTTLGTQYDIYEVDGEIVGQQFPTDTGPMDILAISKDKKELLVIELKKGRASDAVIGQIQRYMGYAQYELAESDQTVKGMIIGLQSDLRLKRALSVIPNIIFLRYEVNFTLKQND